MNDSPEAPPIEERVRASYDVVAQIYDDRFGAELDHKPLDRALLGAFCDMAAPGTVVDIGCGPGHITEFLGGVAKTL